MNAATDFMGRTMNGVEDVGREVGVTAVAAVRGSMHAAERLGADLLSVARSAVEGTIDAAERIGGAATRAVKQIANVEKPSRKPSAVPTGAKQSSRRRKKSRPSEQAGSATP
jgi:hypothetical protein